MSQRSENAYEHFLERYDDAAWAGVINNLLPSLHEVERTSTQIWFNFFPLALLRALQEAEDPAKLASQLLLEGNYYLKDQIDSSHHFLYGHRFWPQVKETVVARAENSTQDATLNLETEIRETAREVAARLKTDESLLLGITAVALMTLEQVGLADFRAAKGSIVIDEKQARKSPAQVLKERARDDSQGLLGFLKTVDKEWTITFDENQRDAKYKLTHAQDLAFAAASDTRDWRSVDARRKEGPIPVQCRSASCGTCWVGILGGAEKLSDVSPRLEGKRIKEFGYIETDEPKPLIRLACQAQAFGAVSIVIPPWNGQFGKYLKEREESPKSKV